MYTDGCAVISDNSSENMRIPDGSSILTAEEKAIDLALDFIADCEISNNFIIFTDSFFHFEVSRPYIIKKSTNSKTTWKATWFIHI